MADKGKRFLNLSSPEELRIRSWAEDFEEKSGGVGDLRGRLSIEMTKKDAAILAKALSELLRTRY